MMMMTLSLISVDPIIASSMRLFIPRTHTENTLGKICEALGGLSTNILRKHSHNCLWKIHVSQSWTQTKCLFKSHHSLSLACPLLSQAVNSTL